MLCNACVGDFKCVCRLYAWEISPTLVLVFGVALKQNGKNKRGTLEVQEPGSLYSNSNIFCFYFLIHHETKLKQGLHALPYLPF
jgi:hypothetical protein